MVIRIFQISQKMEIPECLKVDTVTYLFFDEEQQNSTQKPRFREESVKDEFKLNFCDLLDQEWSIESEGAPFFSTKKQMDKFKSSQEIENHAQSFANNMQNNKMVAPKRKKKQKHKEPLKSIFTIFDSPIPVDDVDMFLESGSFQYCLRFFVILNLVGLLLTDYSFRLIKNESSETYIPLSLENKISLHFQLLANCAFTFQILFKLWSKNPFFANPWNIINVIGTVACWSSIFDDMMEFDENVWFQFLTVLKILRGIRVIEVFQFIRNPFEVFITTIPDLGKIFFPLLIFIMFYSILGLILFQGSNEHRCRETPEPQDSLWPEVDAGLCGSDDYQCKTGYCGNPFHYDLPLNQTQYKEYDNQYGLVNYDNIGSALLTTYHYVFLSNWTNIKYKFSRYLSPYITSLYFFTLAIFLFFILANLNMITICKAYIEKEKEMEKKGKHGKQLSQKKDKQCMDLSKLPECRSHVLDILRYSEAVLIIVQSIILVLDYQGIPIHFLQSLTLTDFILTWIALSILILRCIILREFLWADSFIIFDCIILLITVGELIYTMASAQSIIHPGEDINKILRSIKILRIIKLLYFSPHFFEYEKTILRMFIETVQTIKYFFLLLFCVVLVVSFIGENLFAFRVRFIKGTHILDIQNGDPYVSNFQSTYKSIVSVILLLENERWTETMYNYYEAVGWQSLAFFNIVVFIIHSMLTRLFIAIFLCYFRRNLQKNNTVEQQKQQGGESNEDKSVEPEKEKVDKEDTNQADLQSSCVPEEYREPAPPKRLFWFFNRHSCFFQMFRSFFLSRVFNYLILFAIILHSSTIIIRTNDDSEDKILLLDYIEFFPYSIYFIEVVVGIFGFGFYFEEKSYLKHSKMHFVNLIVLILIVLSKITLIDPLISRALGRLAIIKIFTLFTRAGKETSISLKAISAIAERFLRAFAVYLFLLLIPAIIPLKLQKDGLYYCQNAYPFSGSLPTNAQDCMMAGGDWLKETQSFSNIFSSIILMYQVVTSQSWTHFIERSSENQPWDLYFVLVFFLYNTCLLNIFVGLTVETYLTLKDEAYKLNLLRPNQRGWILIKNSINDLVPLPSVREPENTWIFRKICYWVVTKPMYSHFMDFISYLNVFLYMLSYYRSPEIYSEDIRHVNTFFVSIFMVDTFLKLQLFSDYFYLENSRIQLLGFLFYLGYGLTVLITDISRQTFLILEFFGALVLILRCKKLIFRFTWSKTLVNSVLDVLPKCLRIGGILGVFLFFYAVVGMEIFKYTKYHPKADGYTNGFANFFTATMTLLKIVSNEAWFEQVSVFVRGSTPADVCFEISNFQDAQTYSHMGCGSYIAYAYFVSFHILMSLLILNVLIATMTSAYDENYEKQYKSVNIFQLQDCLELWQKYDPQGTGVIPYKKFWRLSSQIAILFGISKKKLIKRKEKFLEELDIEICQSVNSGQSSVLCYKFHDVLTKFSKVKLQVSNSEVLDENGQWMDFEIHPLVEREIEDYITKVPAGLYENYQPYKNYKSGEMKYFFGLLRKLRAWRHAAKKGNVTTTSKLSHIIRQALEKKQKDESQKNSIKQSIIGSLGYAKRNQ